MEDALLKNAVLSKDLPASFQERSRARQESTAMEFMCRKEAKHNAIEAKGIAKYYRIVTKDITQGIRATKKLA